MEPVAISDISDSGAACTFCPHKTDSSSDNSPPRTTAVVIFLQRQQHHRNWWWHPCSLHVFLRVLTVQTVTSHRNILVPADSSDALLKHSIRNFLCKAEHPSTQVYLDQFWKQKLSLYTCTRETVWRNTWLTDTPEHNHRERCPLPKWFNLKVPWGREILGKNETVTFPPRQLYIFGFAYWNTKSYNSKGLEPTV